MLFFVLYVPPYLLSFSVKVLRRERLAQLKKQPHRQQCKKNYLAPFALQIGTSNRRFLLEKYNMVRWEGHEIGVLSTLVGCVGILQGSMPKGWAKGFIHRHPIPAMSCFLFTVGVTLPVTVVPLRRALGMPTNQYDAEHPGIKYPTYKSLE